jgi:hypothetical protein
VFQELCALSTTGELTTEEWARLSEHLVHCRACREIKQQYERMVATALPAMAEQAATEPGGESSPGAWSIEAAEETLMESLEREPAPSRGDSVAASKSLRWKHARRYAMAAMILAACTLGGYKIGVLRERRSDVAVAPAAPTAPRTPSHVAQPAPSAVPTQQVKAVPEDDQSVALRDQVRRGQLETARLKDRLSQLGDELAKQRADLDRSVEERADLNRKLAEAQANAQGLQARLSLIGEQTSQDTAQSLALKAQVTDLNAAIEAKNLEIAREQELLQHDRDIRNLIGARNLYIAEIYDVAKTGDTEKPFGRVFYTKDKSLIFYGYDLDQQQGVKKDSAFQAWGRRGTDQKHDISLGLLYQDDANKKRWVLKFNDAKTIAEIDAVFVTVEPEGGSAKPSGKPLLFTYLRLDPNHP